MVYIKSTVILSLLAAVSAAPVDELEARAIPKNTAFGFLALRSASPIHFQSLNANGGRIWIGKTTSISCPRPAAQCPKGKTTSMLFSSSGTVGMNVIVPGGQQLYIGPTGELAYTQVHSTAIPSGSTENGFKLTEINHQTYLSNGNNDFLACPLTKKTAKTGPWKVFVNVNGKLKDKDVPSGCKTDCLGFSAVGSAVKDAVWQYS